MAEPLAAAPDPAAIEERRAWQRALVDESPLPISMAEDGFTSYGNAEYLKLFGFERLEELRGRPLLEQIAPESRAAMQDRVERRKRGEVVPASIEVVALRKDGSRFVDLITSKTLLLPTGPAVFAFHEDITARREAEQSLRAREERLRALAASLPVFVMELSLDGNIQFINRVLPHLSVEQVIGRSWLEFIPPENHDLARRTLAQVLTTGETQSFETLGEGPGGRPSWYLSRISPLQREGMLTGLTLITDDITAQREVQRALRASEARYRALIEQAPVPIGIHRRGVPIYANQAFYKLHGMRAIEDLGPLGLLGLVAPESRPMVLEHVRRRSAGLPTASDYEYVGLRCDGTTFPCFTHVVPVEFDDGPATLVFHDDLTSVRRAMEALRASEERFRALLEQSAEGVLVLDDKGTITEWNLAMARITGVSGAAARGRSGWDQMMELAIPEEGSPGRLERVRHGLLAALEGGGPPPLSAETSIRRTDGEVRRVGQTAFTLKLGGKPALGVLFQDITERKAAEEARERAERQLHQTQKMEALGTLSGGIAHDFNNLLSVVLVDAEVLQERLPEGDELRVLADEILSSGLRARELVRRILTFARRQEPARRPERLEAVAAEALKLLHASLAPNVAIELDAAPGTPAAQIDANQLHQVLTNLATNAAHAMGAAGGLLRVELAAAAFTTEQVAGRPELRPGRFVRLTVRDTGSGMTPETQKRIFEPFFTTKPVGQGTGLGLSIVHGIVASHDGFITVESKPGEGSAFHLHFPAHEAPAAAVAQQESPMSAVPAAALRVLLVDDEELVLRASGRMLSKKGLVVTPFSSPKAAVAAFTADPSAFDAALIDLAMPEMSGLELAARLTAARPGFPVLLASGNASAVGAEQARSAGIKEIVGKPYDAKTLLDAVERATRGA